MGLKFKLKVFGREFEGKPFFKRVSLNNTCITSIKDLALLAEVSMLCDPVEHFRHYPEAIDTESYDSE